MVEAAGLLADHLPIFRILDQGAGAKPAGKTESVLDESIDRLELGGRINNMLRNAGIETVRDLVGTDEDDLEKIQGFGKKALTEVREKLETLGLGLGVRFDLPQS